MRIDKTVLSENNADLEPGIRELASRLRFSFDTGHIWLAEDRMVLIHTAAFGSLRKELVDTLGLERARGLLTRMGLASGERDADRARKLYPDISDYELLLKGPLLHTLEGIVKVTPIKLDIDIAQGIYYGEFLWENSFEGEVNMQAFGLVPGPTCWMQLGYASGYTSKIMGKFILYKEPECSASGSHKACRIIGKPLEEWDETESYLNYFKPESVVEQILELQSQVEKLRYSIDDTLTEQDIVGRSSGFKASWSLIKKAAASQITVLLLGETGVGKEMFARALHKLSPRANGPFIAVNCAALPSELIESELFGVEKGAYTGAQQSRPGRFERAHWGTLLLDEVGELSASAQAKLLRVLQEGELERIGDSKTRKVDVRVIAATNVNLQDAVNQGKFRKDLFYRLSVYPVTIPPLRERTDDISLLVERFLAKYNTRYSKKIVGVTDKAMHAMRKYPWPGNVRELENIIERGVILAPNDGRIDSTDLFPALTENDMEEISAGLDQHGHLLKYDQQMASNLLDHMLSHKTSLDDVEATVLEAAVQRAKGNLSSAARLLGITRPQLAYRLNKVKEA